MDITMGNSACECGQLTTCPQCGEQCECESPRTYAIGAITYTHIAPWQLRIHHTPVYEGELDYAIIEMVIRESGYKAITYHRDCNNITATITVQNNGVLSIVAVANDNGECVQTTDIGRLWRFIDAR